jgi:hypothetical protein
MTRRWCKRLLLGALAGALLVVGYDRVQGIHWVGSTDLEVEFTVTDAATGSPIPGARVEIQQAKGGFYEDRDEKEFVLISDDDGQARRDCRQSMCFGTQSGLAFTDTFAVHLPYWRFRVVAAGFEPSKWTELDELRYRRQARRAGSGKSKLMVSISLQKGGAEPAAAPDRGGQSVLRGSQAFCRRGR